MPRTLLCLALFTSFLAPAVQSALPPFISASADTHIAEQAPGTNYGRSSTAAVHFFDFIILPANNVAILRFDVSSLTSDDIASLQTAALQLSDPNHDNPLGSLSEIQLQCWLLLDESQDNWGEEDAAWNSGAPAHKDDGIPFNGPDLTSDAVQVGAFNTSYPDGNSWTQPIYFGTAIADAIRADTNGLITLFVTTISSEPLGSAISTREATPDLAPRLVLSSTPPPDPVDPGYGLDTHGGAGGRVIKVTNLDTSGSGSFAAAVTASGARTVVFEVGGVIDLARTELRITNPFLTVAGHTAPSPGITLIRGGIVIQTHDVLLQHIAVRTGDAGLSSDWEIDAISTRPAGFNDVHHVVIDHCSTSWATDENLSAGGSPDGSAGTTLHSTFSNCIIAEGLDESTHDNGPHSKGTLILDGNQHIAIIGNLYAQNDDRNPQFKGGTTGVVLNNFVANPRAYALRFREGGINEVLAKPVATVIGNILAPGEDTEHGNEYIAATGEEGGRIFAQFNTSVASDGSFGAVSYTRTTTFLPYPPYLPSGFQPLDPESAYIHAFRSTGSRPGDRDPIDARIVAAAMAGDGRIIDSQNDVGGYPSYPMTQRPLSPPSTGLDSWLRAHEAAVSAPGLPAWTTLHFSLQERFDHRLSSPTADPDNDMLDNFTEFSFATDPRSPDSALPDLTIGRSAGGRYTISYLRSAGADLDTSYLLETSTGLTTWSPAPPGTVEVTTVTTLSPTLERVTLTLAPQSFPARHFRIAASPR